MSAVVANGETREAVPAFPGFGARDVGIQGFQAVNQPVLDQPIERPVDLYRCGNPRLAKTVEQCIGTKRPLRLLQRCEHELLVGRQLHWNSLSWASCMGNPSVVHCPKCYNITFIRVQPAIDPWLSKPEICSMCSDTRASTALHQSRVWDVGAN